MAGRSAPIPAICASAVPLHPGRRRAAEYHTRCGHSQCGLRRDWCAHHGFAAQAGTRKGRSQAMRRGLSLTRDARKARVLRKAEICATNDATVHMPRYQRGTGNYAQISTRLRSQAAGPDVLTFFEMGPPLQYCSYNTLTVTREPKGCGFDVCNPATGRMSARGQGRQCSQVSSTTAVPRLADDFLHRRSRRSRASS